MVINLCTLGSKHTGSRKQVSGFKEMNYYQVIHRKMNMTTLILSIQCFCIHIQGVSVLTDQFKLHVTVMM